MKAPTQEKLEETYSQLNSEALLELYEAGTLTPLAESVARKELKRRGVTITPYTKKTRATVTSEGFKLEDIFDDVSFVAGILAVGFFIGMPVILGYQSYIWAKTGTWPPIPISFGLEAIGMNLDAIYQPTDWYGLAALAYWFIDLPMAFGFFWAGFLFILLWSR